MIFEGPGVIIQNFVYLCDAFCAYIRQALKDISLRANLLYFVSVLWAVLGLSIAEPGNSCRGTADKAVTPVSFISNASLDVHLLYATSLEASTHSIGAYATKNHNFAKEDAKWKKHTKDVVCAQRFDKLNRTPSSDALFRHWLSESGLSFVLSLLCRLNI